MLSTVWDVKLYNAQHCLGCKTIQCSATVWGVKLDNAQHCLGCKTVQCSATVWNVKLYNAQLLFGMQVYTSVGWVTQCLFRLPVFCPQVTLSVILLTSDEQNLRTNDPKSFKSNSLTKLSNLLKTAIYQTLPRINGNLKRC